MLYIILLDRARLSQKNEGWSDTDGHVFIYFTIEALAEVLHKSQMTVKTALAVLEKQELIFRKRQGPGQPNRIYLKTSGLQDKALYDYTFARDNGINPEIKLAHNYVSNWEEIKQTLPDFSSGVMSVLENLFLQVALPMPFWKKAFLY